ncbi:hypothetical protein L1887_09043 [Cichorium endivia]|nr:hypothetical protein L1887_09043 [Cichorium endivia]
MIIWYMKCIVIIFFGSGFLLFFRMLLLQIYFGLMGIALEKGSMPNRQGLRPNQAKCLMPKAERRSRIKVYLMLGALGVALCSGELASQPGQWCGFGGWLEYRLMKEVARGVGVLAETKALEIARNVIISSVEWTLDEEMQD